MDVIISFAQAAALAPNQYVRPVVHPKGSGILNLQVSASHLIVNHN
jgi:DNA mismatch repair ATPase MutS